MRVAKLSLIINFTLRPQRMFVYADKIEILDDAAGARDGDIFSLKLGMKYVRKYFERKKI